MVYGNIIARTGNGIMVHGGKNNQIENNVIIDSKNGISFVSCCYGRPNAVTMVDFG